MARRVQKRQVVWVLCLCGILSSCKDPHSNAALDLIGAFDSSCVTSGNWTQQALSHAQSITTAIQNIQNNDPCKAFQASLGTIQSASQQIQSIIQDQSYSTYRTSEETVQELSLALQSAPKGSTLRDALQTALIQAQVTLTQNQASNQVDQAIQGRNRYATSTAQLASFSQQMLQQSAGLAQCLQSSPSVAIELASNAMALGGNFVSPVVGATAATIAQLVNLGIEYARQSGTADALWKLNEIRMPNALGCGLESMSELYCDANDAMSLLSLLPDSAIEHPVPEFWKGADILVHRLPVLDHWLLSIRNGVLPGDPQEAQRQNLIWQKLDALDQTYRNVYALQAQAKLLYDASTNDPMNQQNILVKAIQNSINSMTGGSGSIVMPGSANPFTDQTTDSDLWACWLVFGPTMQPPNQAAPNTPHMCPLHMQYSNDYGESYVRNHLLQGTTFQNLVDNWENIYQKVKRAVDVQFAQTITANPESILASSKEATIDNISPYEVLKRVEKFLHGQMQQDDGNNPNKPPFVKSILSVVQKAIQTVDATEINTIDRVTELFDMFQLSHGLQYIDSSISQIVNWDLADRVRRHEYRGEMEDVLRTSGSEVLSRLTAAGIKDLDSIQLDLNQVRTITSGNLELFREFFSPALAKAIHFLKNSAISHGEPTEGIDRPFGQTLAHLCTLVLSTGMEWPKELPWEDCSTAVLNSIFPDPDNKITIRVDKLAQELKGKPFATRLCSFHRFLRAGRYAEIYGAHSRDHQYLMMEPGNLLKLAP